MKKRIATKSLAPLLAAAALPFTPALAQEVALPQVQAPPPAAEPAPAPAPQAAPAMVFAPQKAVVQNAPPPGPQAEDLARQAQADAAARRTVRSAPAPRTAAPVRTARVTQTTTTAAPAAAAPAPAPAVTPAPEATPTPAEAPTVAAPAADTTAPATVQQTTTQSTSSLNWLWVGLGALAIAAIGALLFFRRRRADEDVYYDDTVYEEPAYVEPVAVAPIAPLAAAPVHEPEVVAAVANRPQIELGIRPIRAGSDNGQARVDYEVIVENAGALDARDVTVTSWLLNADSSQAESDMIETQINVAAGDVTTVQGSATVDNARGAFRPVVATDARYTLPDGTEGHIAARFAVGVDGGEPGRITPIVLDRDELREDLGARLEGEVERV